MEWSDGEGRGVVVGTGVKIRLHRCCTLRREKGIGTRPADNTRTQDTEPETKQYDQRFTKRRKRKEKKREEGPYITAAGEK